MMMNIAAIVCFVIVVGVMVGMKVFSDANEKAEKKAREEELDKRSKAGK